MLLFFHVFILGVISDVARLEKNLLANLPFNFTYFSILLICFAFSVCVWRALLWHLDPSIPKHDLVAMLLEAITSPLLV